MKDDGSFTDGIMRYITTGNDPNFSKFSIGIVHLYYVIQYCIERNGASFSLLRGDEAYKFKFTNRTMPQYSILIYKNNLLGKTMYWGKRSLLFAKKSIKRILKSVKSDL